MALAKNSLLPPSLQALDDPYANGNDDAQAAQSQFERDREGPDPTMQMNPQWAQWLDMAKQANDGQMPVFGALRRNRLPLAALAGLSNSQLQDYVNGNS